MSKYKAEELIRIIENHRKGGVIFVEAYKRAYSAIIAKLRAADKLCEAAKGFLPYGRKCPPGCRCGYDEAERELRKAIAEHEKPKEISLIVDE